MGSACLPRDEFEPGFAGFFVDEVTIETANDDCAAESVCLVKNFRGRVSCPYGQTAMDMSLPEDHPGRCIVPKHGGKFVTVEVQPQLVQTSGIRGVYCSALCADAHGRRDDGRRYHDCPPNFHCEPMLDSLLAKSDSLHGSYCVRNDSPDKATLLPMPCDSSNPQANCGAARPYE